MTPGCPVWTRGGRRAVVDSGPDLGFGDVGIAHVGYCLAGLGSHNCLHHQSAYQHQDGYSDGADDPALSLLFFALDFPLRLALVALVTDCFLTGFELFAIKCSACLK